MMCFVCHVRLWPWLSTAYSWNSHWSLTSPPLLGRKVAEDTATPAAVPTSHAPISITHQTTQCWNNLKITAGTQQGKSVIGQLCEGNIPRERSFPVNPAPGWLLEQGLWQGANRFSSAGCVEEADPAPSCLQNRTGWAKGLTLCAWEKALAEKGVSSPSSLPPP